MADVQPIEPLSDDTKVFRSVTRAADFQDNRPLLQAFMRRARDTDGLSVDYNVTVPDGCGVGLSDKRAVLELLVGEIRATEFMLDVIADLPTHANITGLPEHHDLTQRERALQIAARLVELSEVVWSRKKQHA